MSSPFELPELANVLSKYLDRHDLTTCVRVSHDWYEYFIRFLWTEIPFFKNAFAPKASSISKHATLIRSLKTVEVMIPQISSINFPFLQKLELSNVGTSLLDFPLSSSCMILKNLALKELVLNGYEASNPVEFWEWIYSIKTLDTVHLRQTNITSETADVLWKIFCRLQSASFENGLLPDSIFSAATSPSEMKKLSLRFTEIVPLQQQLEIFRRCKGLEYLDWGSCCQNKDIIDSLCSHISQGSWSSLHALHLPFINLDSNSLQHILRSPAKWTELRFKSATWDIESFDALSTHFESLKLLDVSGGNNSFTSVMVNTVLSSCPNLRILSAPPIQGMDIVSNNQINKVVQPSKGWICTKLTDLTLQFDLSGLDSQSQVLERIATLVDLRLLDISSRDMDYSSIALTLDKGLDILRSIKNIYSLRFKKLAQVMTKEDIDWIALHWKNLKYIDGELHHDKNHCRVLRRVLISRGTRGH